MCQKSKQQFVKLALPKEINKSPTFKSDLFYIINIRFIDITSEIAIANARIRHSYPK
ncbi:hypothetical protein [Helicobacter pylori]|uniref:Uncharacterized protein n=1 Tax=Helicobacter pylori UM037 TaxID=1321939 RepID=A0AB33Z624_HELPX|nr:hypothetical protein [Helicobacter pylori]EQK94564.1 hypothetical protein N198_01380 [Helicobacter pylori UM037]MCQ2907868.1 hypothetical protein [Helicobacter pylori]WQS78935.1 hypothetical protein KVC48_07795 [Helicobacter pylori]WQS84648.1 hypothetical protein KVB94_08190 [Helicobacter pylori]WQX54979.1 hypothetical protein KVM87_07875 [Helicobacter pylori]